MKRDFYLVWSEPSCYTKFRHDTREEAQKEAERLSRIDKEKRFYVLYALESCAASDICWDTPGASGDDLPF